MFVFCKIPISIPINIETSIHRYFARRYSEGAGTGYRCTALMTREREGEFPFSPFLAQ